VSKPAIDKDLKRVSQLSGAARANARAIAAPGLALLFLLAALIWATWAMAGGPQSYLVIIATVIAAYMALNIGANDVANNMGPAVGSRALTLTGALAIAAVCEAAGAILAGGDVVNTVARDLLRPDEGFRTVDFILIMMAALMAAAMWLHLATILGAPVSTTHSIIGGVIGAGVAAAGTSIVHWPMIAAIVASWVTSPVMGGVIAASLLAFVKFTILFPQDRVAAARRWVPILVGLMSGVFAMYLASKGLSRVWRPPVGTVLVLGVLFFFAGWFAARPWVARRSRGMENRRKQISSLFNLPLTFAAALLSFAHGANDVANAVGPLAAIVAAAQTGAGSTDAVVLPLWILVIGAVGIAIGLALFGPRVMRTVGEKITKMDAIRAFCVALAAAITVLVASALGLPISSTHTAVGAVFGVGFLREILSNTGVPNPAVQPSTMFLNTAKLNSTPEAAIKNYQKRERRKLVRRQHVAGITAAWIVTVPAAALLAGMIYYFMSAVAG
jgi:inorganic phosphate transporter, PiT family